MGFNRWWRDLRRLATENGALELIGNDQESYRGYYDDDCSTSDVLSDLRAYAAANDYLGRNIKEGE
jgi:hypothetical protein